MRLTGPLSDPPYSALLCGSVFLPRVSEGARTVRLSTVQRKSISHSVPAEFPLSNGEMNSAVFPLDGKKPTFGSEKKKKIVITLWVNAQKVFPCPNEDFPYISKEPLITAVRAAITAAAAKV